MCTPVTEKIESLLIFKIKEKHHTYHIICLSPCFIAEYGIDLDKLESTVREFGCKTVNIMFCLTDRYSVILKYFAIIGKKHIICQQNFLDAELTPSHFLCPLFNLLFYSMEIEPQFCFGLLRDLI